MPARSAEPSLSARQLPSQWPQRQRWTCASGKAARTMTGDQNRPGSPSEFRVDTGLLARRALALTKPTAPFRGAGPKERPRFLRDGPATNTPLGY